MKKFALRTFGGTFSILADIGWIAAVVVIGLMLFAAPTLKSWLIPAYGASVHQLFLDFAVPAALTLGVLQVLSGRWGPPGLHAFDKRISALALLALSVMCVVVFYFGYGKADQPAMVINMLLAFTIGALLDYLVAKGEDFRASSLREENVELHAQIEQLKAQLGVPSGSVSPNTVDAAPFGTSDFGEQRVLDVPTRMRVVDFVWDLRPQRPVVRPIPVIEHEPETQSKVATEEAPQPEQSVADTSSVPVAREGEAEQSQRTH